MARLLVIGAPDSPELKELDALPKDVAIVAVGQTVAELSKKMSESDWASIDVLLNCGVGARAGKRVDIEEMWPKLTGLKWMHSASAGLEHLLFPALVESNVVLTNAKGVYSHSLAEYTLTCCNWFAKDLPRLRAAQGNKKWDPFCVEELRNKTLGVIGFGDIGQASARLAKAFKMNVVACRRRTEMTDAEKAEGLVDSIMPSSEAASMVAQCDYVVAALPHTPGTHEFVSASVIGAMQPHCVFINVGRGKTVDEPALIEALKSNKIRGAGLDVFYTEPLPADSPLWELDNVLMSPHCADLTKEFQNESLQFFVANMGRHLKGEGLLNICDKVKGY